MIRSQVYLTEEERQALARLADETGRPQSELIREAIDAFLARQAPRERRVRLQRALGLWRERVEHAVEQLEEGGLHEESDHL